MVPLLPQSSSQPTPIPPTETIFSEEDSACTEDQAKESAAKFNQEDGHFNQEDRHFENDSRKKRTAKRRRRSSLFSPAISTGIAILAVCLSYIGISRQQKSIEEGRRLAYDGATQRLIHDQYELCRELDQLRIQHPVLSHVLALPTTDPDDPWKNYRGTKQRVNTVLTDAKTITAADKEELVLQEQGLALHVFDIYEQTIYQWQMAEAAKDAKRTEVLKMLVDYYEGRMLRNPRLRYHWDHGGSDMMEAIPTRQRYDTYVRVSSDIIDSRYPKDFVDEDSPVSQVPLNIASTKANRPLRTSVTLRQGSGGVSRRSYSSK